MLFRSLSVILGTIGQLFAIYHPLGQQIFETVALTGKDWLAVLAASSSGFIVIELLKFIKDKKPALGKWIPISSQEESDTVIGEVVPAFSKSENPRTRTKD